MFSHPFRRFIHLSCHSSSVRVRFAPSPTGYIHLGGLRTALYNFLFAKANSGKFILRIEDTDQKRLVPGAAVQLETDLDWMGLSPDESPIKDGGFGPYTQSKRLPLYSKFVQELVKSGHAYYCFCSDRRLEFVKKEALREGAIPRYDNRCRQLSSAQVEEKKQQRMASCVRFKLSPLDEPLQDLVYGNIDRSAVLHEGDPVILKQDGYPTYHLANVVDDHLMGITHVLRGTEWLVSTAKHVLLYNAFGWTPPSFAHLPLILNPDGTKLSKRQDDIRLEYFRKQGFYPEAIIGLLCLVGGGFSPSIDIQKNLHSLSELAKAFNLGIVTTHSGRLDGPRLEYFNRLALQNRINHPEEIDKLSEELFRLIHDKIKNSSLDKDMVEKASLLKILHWASNGGRINFLHQLTDSSMGFLWNSQESPIVSKIDPSTARNVLIRVIQMLNERDRIQKNEVTTMLGKIATEYNLKLKEVLKLMRSSLTGLKEGPPVSEVMEILGPQICANRLGSSLNLIV
ncbi:probable glutamate--tRNA ligase, mitochondrial [Daphnia pulex]|uniref:probable glutamate--tRNA ligase, mitochondrial n=1 Tax=Daphnia pulex TaxID=6669 RepID=UPI001EDD34B5|nr:probable glutamate--tRNA ligase, mitochondrial [Daphnia pulex]